MSTPKDASRVKGDWKATTLEYDKIKLIDSEDQCTYCLSSTTVAICLTLIDTAYWLTRWYSESQSQIDLDWIQAVVAKAENELMSNQCNEGVTNERWTPAGMYQQSYDNGETWHDAPQKDERWTGIKDADYSATDGQCLAAANIAAFMDYCWSELEQPLVDAVGAIAFASAIIAALLIIFSGGLAFPLAIAVANLIIGLNLSEIQAEWGATFIAEVKCAILCDLPTDGQVDEAIYYNMVQSIQAETGAAWRFVEAMFYILGVVGIQRAAHRAGITSADCSECGLCECETIILPVTSGAVLSTSFNSQIGTNYTVIITGTAKIGQDVPSGEYTGDAWYYRTTVNPTWLYVGAGNGVFINGAQPSPVPSFNASHVYMVTVPGSGSPITFQWRDPSYVENEGSLTIEVCED